MTVSQTVSDRKGVGVMKQVTNLAGWIRGIRSRICQDIRVSDLAVSPAGFWRNRARIISFVRLWSRADRL